MILKVYFAAPRRQNAPRAETKAFGLRAHAAQIAGKAALCARTIPPSSWP
jgi:hypothetical protein